MKIYRITVRADKYPTDYTVQASSWRAAIGRALAEWAKGKGRGSRSNEVVVKAIKSGELLKENES